MINLLIFSAATSRVLIMILIEKGHKWRSCGSVSRVRWRGRSVSCKRIIISCLLWRRKRGGSEMKRELRCMEKPWRSFKNRKVLSNLDSWGKERVGKGCGDTLLQGGSSASVNIRIVFAHLLPAVLEGGSSWLLYCELLRVCRDYKSRGPLVLWNISTCLKLCLENCNATNTLQGFSLVNYYHTWEMLYFFCTVEWLASMLYWCHSNFQKHSEEFLLFSFLLYSDMWAL